jgi:hypothetical protein
MVRSAMRLRACGEKPTLSAAKTIGAAKSRNQALAAGALPAQSRFVRSIARIDQIEPADRAIGAGARMDYIAPRAQHPVGRGFDIKPGIERTGAADLRQCCQHHPIIAKHERELIGPAQSQSAERGQRHATDLPPVRPALWRARRRWGHERPARDFPDRQAASADRPRAVPIPRPCHRFRPHRRSHPCGRLRRPARIATAPAAAPAAQEVGRMWS